jgi:hypothetical protein
LCDANAANDPAADVRRGEQSELEKSELVSEKKPTPDEKDTKPKETLRGEEEILADVTDALGEIEDAMKSTTGFTADAEQQPEERDALTATTDDPSLPATTTTTAALEKLHHFRFSIELMRVRGVLSGACGLLFRYAYAGFGSGAPCETFRPVLPPAGGGEVAIGEAFTAFEFSMTPQRLSALLCSEPLLIELTTKDAPNEPERQVGVAAVRLEDVLHAPKRRSGLQDGMVRAIAGWYPVCEFPEAPEARPTAAETRIVGHIFVGAAVENLGVIGPAVPLQEVESGAAKSGRTSAMALEMEVFKQQERARMAEALEVAKREATASLEAVFATRQKENAKRCAALEKQAAESNKRIAEVLERTKEREATAIRAEVEAKERAESALKEAAAKVREVQLAAKHLREDCGRKELALRERIEQLEQCKRDLEAAATQRTATIKELEAQCTGLRRTIAESPIVSLQSKLEVSEAKRAELEKTASELTEQQRLRKEKLVRALREIARLRQEREEQGTDEAQRLRSEIGTLRQQQASTRAQLEADLLRTQIRDVSARMPARTPRPPAATPSRAVASLRESERLVAERNQLLQTGLYDESSELVQQLDSEIRRLEADSPT